MEPHFELEPGRELALKIFYFIENNGFSDKLMRKNDSENSIGLQGNDSDSLRLKVTERVRLVKVSYDLETSFKNFFFFN